MARVLSAVTRSHQQFRHLEDPFFAYRGNPSIAAVEQNSMYMHLEFRYQAQALGSALQLGW